MNSAGWRASVGRGVAAAFVVLVAGMALVACGDGDGGGAPAPKDGAAGPSTNEPRREAKAKPAPGTGNVQGKVLYNDVPVSGIEVTLCETFSRFLGGCSGEQYEAVTADDGIYVVADVAPGEYEGLLVRVFDTDRVQFATSGVVSAKSYTIKPDETVFVDDTHLFKADLAVTAPAAGSSVPAAGLALTWDAYPDAAYYELSIHSEDVAKPSPVIGQRVDDTSYEPPDPLPAGSYRLTVKALNAKGRILADNGDGYVFTATD